MLASYCEFQGHPHISRCFSGNPRQDLNFGCFLSQSRTGHRNAESLLWQYKLSDSSAASRIFSSKFKRLCLRRSAPTPGERNIRIQWQRNSGGCNKLLTNQVIKHRLQNVSRPESRASRSQNVCHTSSSKHYIKNDLTRQHPSSITIKEESRNKQPAETDEFQVFSIAKQTLVPRQFTKTEKHPCRSNSTSVQCKPCRASSNTQSNGQIYQLSNPPCTPLNSPNCSKGLKIVSKLAYRPTKATYPKGPQNTKIKKLHSSSALNCSSESQRLCLELNKPYSNGDPDITSCKNDASYQTTKSHKNNEKKSFPEPKTSHQVLASEVNKKLTQHGEKEMPAQGRNTMQLNLTKSHSSDQLHDLTSKQQPFIRIKSFKPETEIKQTEESCQKMQKDQKITVILPKQQSSTQPSPHITCQNNKTTPPMLSFENPLLNIKHISNEHRHVTRGMTSLKRNELQPGLKTHWKMKRTCFQKESKRDNKFRKQQHVEEQNNHLSNSPQLVAPNPSLVNFDKKDVYGYQQGDFCKNSLFENDQDPAVMLRILAWLDKVENNADFYYGFDDQELHQNN